MDIAEIEAFMSTAELGGFSRAASRLYRSQPAISRRIGLLEDELGAKLLERVRGGVRLTEAGRAFLPYAEAAVAALKDGREAVRALASEERGTLSLALVGTLANTYIVDVLRRFARRRSELRLELRTANSREVSDLVRRGEVTLGLRYYVDDSADLVSRIVAEEALFPVASAEHPLARRRLKDASALRGERWVGFPPSRTQRESHGSIMERQLIAAGLEDAEIMPVDSLTAQKRLVEAGFGLALLPESSIGEELRLGTLRVLRVPGLRTQIPVSVIHRRNGYLSTAARALLALMSGPALRTKKPTRRRR
jgi:DNA-binding transcriptional LysR family regulator